MRKKLTSWLIVFLIVIVFIANTVQRRDNFECLVLAHADRYQLIVDQGVATVQEIHDAVWTDMLAEYHNHTWRMHLDNVYHAIFMGGSRADHVLNRLRNPTDEARWNINCEGGIRWNISAVLIDKSKSPINSKDGKSVYDVTVALSRIPKAELRHYFVNTFLHSDIRVYGHGVNRYIEEWRRVGTVNAEDWLAGQIVPEHWSAWHDRWRQRVEKLQVTEDEPVD